MARALALVSAVLLAAVPVPALAQQAALDRAVERLFRPYSKPPTEAAPTVDERAIWSRDTARLIARWRKVTPQDEVDELGDADWLCQCQDWDEHAFRLTIRSRRFEAPGQASVDVRFRLVRGEWVSARLLLKLEGGAWKLDDIRAPYFEQGLKATIRRTIAEDTKR